MLVQKKAFTLLELLIVVALISIIALGLGSIIVFSSFQTTSHTRRQRVQNALFVPLEHMNRWVSKAIGNEDINMGGINSVVRWYPLDSRLAVYIDYDTADDIGDGKLGTPDDRWIGYQQGIFGPDSNQLRFCSECNNPTCNPCQGGWNNAEIIGRNITDFEVVKPGDPTQDPPRPLNENHITVTITGCWDPDLPTSPIENPCMTMTERIIMPSVSTN